MMAVPCAIHALSFRMGCCKRGATALNVSFGFNDALSRFDSLDLSRSQRHGVVKQGHLTRVIRGMSFLNHYGKPYSGGYVTALYTFSCILEEVSE
jgi:hypothetical protein